MKANRFYFLLMLIFALAATPLRAQKVSFGKVSKQELEEKKCPIDSTAHACVLYSGRNSYIMYKRLSGFVIVDEYHMRIKIYDKDGFDVATNEIPLYHTSKQRETVKKLTGYTYNLENGKIKKTKLDKKNIYHERTSDHITTYKYTMPDVKPGSVVEWKYTVESPFLLRFNDIVLQYNIPAKEVFAEVEIPEYFGYQPVVRGYLPINIDRKNENRSMTLYDTENVRGGTTDYAQEEVTYSSQILSVHKKNIPALKDEPYAGNVDNYRLKIEMELAYVNLPGQMRQDFSLSWNDVAKKIYEDEDFGGQLKKKGYLKKDAEAFASLGKDEKIKAVYEFIKNKIKWNGRKSYWTENGVVKAYKTGMGNVADVNLNLVNMLNAAGIEAYPVLVSSVENGIPLYPSYYAYDYVVAAVPQGNDYLLLDATETFAVPGLLPECPNVPSITRGDWSKKTARPKISTSSLRVIVLCTAMLTSKSMRKAGWKASLRSRKTIISPFVNAKAWPINATTDEIEKALQEKYENLDILGYRLSNLKNPYNLLMESIKFETENYLEEIGDKWYLSPMLEWQMTENPFKSKERHFPIYFNFPRTYTTVIQYTLPEGAKVEKIPEKTTVDLPDNKGQFTYEVSVNGNKILVKNIFILSRPVFPKEDYPQLKDLYEKVKTAHQQKIIIKPY